MTNSDAKQISQQMQVIRRELKDDVKDVVLQTRSLTDWRHFVRTHPWLLLAAGVSLGYLLVPGRPSVGVSGTRGMVGRLVASLVKSVAGPAARGAVTYATGRLAEMATRPLANKDESYDKPEPYHRTIPDGE